MESIRVVRSSEDRYKRFWVCHSGWNIFAATKQTFNGLVSLDQRLAEEFTSAGSLVIRVLSNTRAETNFSYDLAITSQFPKKWRP